jgi:PhnB protein
MSKPKPIPDGYETAIPYLTVSDGNAAIEFYKKAFGAKEVMRMPGPEGKGVGHADLLLFDRLHIMLADEFPDMGNRSPRSLGGSPVMLHIYVEDADKTIERAVAAGAKLWRPVEDQFYGDRAGGVEDPSGHQWWFATQKEIVSPEEMDKRAAEYANKKS